MNLGLSDRLALVTGATEGIGRAISLELAAEGAHVILCARTPSRLEALQAEIEEAGGRATAIAADLVAPEASSQVLAEVRARLARLDILVNNVGGAERFGGFFDLSDEDWVSCFDLNVMTVVRMVRTFAPLLTASAAGRIITVGSVTGLQPGRYNPHYALAKCALLNLNEYLSNEFAASGLTVNLVSAGPVHSAAWDRLLQRLSQETATSLEATAERIDREEAGKIPLGRVGKPGDVAAAVALLASARAGWITGANVIVDGGKVAGIL